MRRSWLTSHAATRAAFVVIIAFVTAQMAWWIYFQIGYVERVNNATLTSLQREASVIDALFEVGASEHALELIAKNPHLRLAADGASAEVDQAALDELRDEQRSVSRMLAFEGPFFVLVVMAGLLIIARNLRSERELKQRQRNFLDAVGHEYKTPISTLRLSLDTLQHRSLEPAKVQEYLRTMSREVDRLERTGQQVLATARMETSASATTPEPGDLGDMVRSALEHARTTFESRGAQLVFEPASVPLPVRAAPGEVVTIVENLVDNAVKYTPGSEKPVVVSLARRGRWATLSVADRGSGIPDGARRKVFERFYRVGSELTRTTPGLGLGLYLVQRIAVSRGGRVRVASNRGGGSVVSVGLPLRPGTETTPVKAETEATA